MKLNKNEKNYLLITLFKSYIFQSAICSVIIVICTAVLHTGLTWILDRYVEHYYLIYRGLYVYMTALIIWVICIMCLTYKLLKKVVGYVYELQAATGRLFDKTGDYIELSPELSEIAVKINHLKQEAENNAKLAQENEQRKNDATKEQMEEALRKVNLLEFMNEQDGINTKLLEQGSNLSGGQKQRLNLARAILHDTPVYIFDEATSNIDAESENEIMAVINKLAETKTVILISHRLQNVVKSDCIYAMKDGKVAEAGTHNELINNNGEYASLYNRQKQLEQYGKGGAVNE